MGSVDRAFEQKEVRIPEVPEKLGFLFKPHRYKVAYGGRGSSKSWSFARALLYKAASKPLRILCCREFQISIQESVHRLLCDQIGLMGLDKDFAVTKQSIQGVNDSEFFFYGVKNNPEKIKSTEGVDIAWVEQAETVSDDSWGILIPTIRKDGSEIWVSFNPDQETDPTYKRFVLNPPDDCLSCEINWEDNRWFPEVLRKEKDYLLRIDPDAYLHIYGGKTKKYSAAQVLHGKFVIESFDPGQNWNGPYFGADWGFANDPTTLIKCWVFENKLFIEKEVYGIGMEIDRIPTHFDEILPSKQTMIRGDCSRPETISYLKNHGYPKIYGAAKWKGSVEDGIAVLRSFEKIVIHPRCTHTVDESRLWSFKTDSLTGDVLPVLIDKHNHCWDAVRYALEPMIKKTSNTGIIDWYREQLERHNEVQGKTE